jgi:hypothetical protein
MQNPGDVLGPLRHLLEALAARPLPTRFFSYSSLNRFCFSASSHYPWVDRGLPVIAPARDGGYLVNDTPHHELPLLSDAFAHQGSSLRPALEQSGAWFRLVVGSVPRRCEVDDRSVLFLDGTRRRLIVYDTLDDAVRAMRAYLEGGRALEAVGAEGAEIALQPDTADT